MCRCRICEYEGNVKRITAYELMYGTKEAFPYFICPNCGCLQIEKVPDDISKYYGSSYYSFADVESSDCIERDSDIRILDVGCGTGAFLCELAKNGYGELVGCDPFIKEDIVYKNGVKIYKNSIHEMEGKFQYIFMNDSFEHVIDPHEVMETAKKILADNGILRIRIPVFPNIAYELFGVNWYQLDAPRHIFLHSINSMKYLTENHGLKIVKTEWDSNNVQIIRSYLYSKGIKYADQTLATIEKFFSEDDIAEIDQRCKEANQNKNGDHAIFYIMHK